MSLDQPPVPERRSGDQWLDREGSTSACPGVGWSDEWPPFHDRARSRRLSLDRSPPPPSGRGSSHEQTRVLPRADEGPPASRRRPPANGPPSIGPDEKKKTRPPTAAGSFFLSFSPVRVSGREIHVSYDV